MLAMQRLVCSDLTSLPLLLEMASNILATKNPITRFQNPSKFSNPSFSTTAIGQRSIVIILKTLSFNSLNFFLIQLCIFPNAYKVSRLALNDGNKYLLDGTLNKLVEY